MRIKYNQFISYLKGILSNRDRHEFEKDVMHDIFEEEAFEGLTRLSADELESDLDILTNRLDERLKTTKKRNMLPYYRLAASIVLLIGIGSTMYFIFRTPSSKLITQKTGEVRIPAPAETKSPTANDTPLVAERRSTPTNTKQQTVQPLSVNRRESATEPEPASKTITPGTVAAEEKEQIQSKPVAPSEEIVVVKIGEVKKADDTGALSEADKNEISPVRKAGYNGYTKPIPPGESVEAFKNWVEERIDTVRFKAFPGIHRISIIFTVQTNGYIRDIRIGNSIPETIAEEYKRIILQSPAWKPAMQDNLPIETQVEIIFIESID